MTVEQLIVDKLDLWTSATTAKATSGRGRNGKLELTGLKKLRELILELAVRGKLVPQDPADEPASVLLEKIAAEKGRLVKEGKIKKPKALPELGEDEKPFDSPDGWMYCRLNEIGTWGSGATPRRGISEYYDGDIPWFKSGELSEDFISISEETITEKALKETSVRLNSPGYVLIAMYGATIGKSSILKVQATTNQAVCACTPWKGIYNLFLLQLLKAYKSRFIGMGAGGAQPNISREKIIATVIVLPPTSEQRRIVEKVDELMGLCDRIETRTLD
ncbi:MAG: restriction endonuclease subunit S, partial [Nodosilinea sp.]